MSISININVVGDDTTKKRLVAVGEALKNMSDVLQPVGEYLKNFYSGAVFTTEGQIIGEPWPELADSTKKQREKKGFSGKGILQRTGDMQKSIKIQTSNNFMILAYTSDYAKYHHSDKPRKKLPRRVLLKIDDNRKIEIIKMISAGFGKKLFKIEKGL